MVLSPDTCSPAILAPRIVEGVGTSLSEDEDVGVGEGNTEN